jgi:hypothetical protein
MYLLLKRFLYISLVAILASNNGFSQQKDSPLAPDKLPGQKEIGIVLGFGQNWQNGKISPTCETCIYENAQKFGYTIGLVYMADIFREMQWGAKLTYDNLSMQSSFRSKESVIIHDEVSDSYPYVNALFKFTGDFTFSALTLTPFVQYDINDFFFARLGFDALYVLNSNLTNTKELLQFKGISSAGDSVDIYIPNPLDPDNSKAGLKSAVLENRAFSDLNKLQFYVDPMIGFNFNFDDYTFISTYFQMAFPLTNLSDKNGGFSINRWRLMLELRFALTARQK